MNNELRHNLEQVIHDPKWLDIIYPFFENGGTSIFKAIRDMKALNGKNVHPKPEECFNAFNYCKYDDMRIIILGQCPYHDSRSVNGLAFSSADEIYCPPSLRNIITEVINDVYTESSRSDISERKYNYSLKSWAEQGVLLLNTSLTVEECNPGSHSHIWKNFTEYILREICNNNVGLIFLLWGSEAKSYKYLIDEKIHHVLEAAHPSPHSAKEWFGNKHFSKTNKIIEQNNGSSYCIKW